MMEMGALGFLNSVGLGFGLAFAGLTGLSLFQFLHVRELSMSGRALALEVVAGVASPRRHWKELAATKSSLAAASSRANLTVGSVPTLALLGTCLGFFYALLKVGGMELGSADPLAILDALMDGGVGTALATTVCGQGIYFLLGQLWSGLVAGPFAEANTLLDEGLAVTRQGLMARAVAPTPARVRFEDPTDAPWPRVVAEGEL